MRTLLAVGPKDTYYTLTKLNKTYILPMLRFCRRQIKGGRQVYLAEEISRQPSIQTVAWKLLTTLSQVYSKNKGQKTEHKSFKTYYFGPERAKCNAWAKVCLLKRLSPPKGINYFIQRQERWLQGISGISKTSRTAGSKMQKYKLFVWEENV